MRYVFSVVVCVFLFVSVPPLASAQVPGSRPAPGQQWPLDLSVAYVGYIDPVVFESLPLDGYYPGSFTNMKYTMEGMQLALAGACRLHEGINAGVTCTWFFPKMKEATETTDRGWLGERFWQDTSTEWWTLEAEISYFPGGYPLALVGGFRYDSFDTRFAEPTRFYMQYGSRDSSPTDEANLHVGLCIPYMGF